MKKPRKPRSLIPEGELACVWMTAGVLDFRLCDREFDCAQCPLDRALRNLPEARSERDEVKDAPPRAGGCTCPDDLFYHRGHTWVRVRPGGELEVGVDDLGRRLLDPVLAIRTPDRGGAVSKDRPAFTVKSRSGDVDLLAPFRGIVTRSNPALANDPGLLGRSPFEEGWVYRAIPDNPARALAGLMEGEDALRFAEAESGLVRDLVDVATADRESAGVGPTLADGGVVTERPLCGVAPEAARKILSRVFGTRER